MLHDVVDLLVRQFVLDNAHTSFVILQALLSTVPYYYDYSVINTLMQPVITNNNKYFNFP